MNGKLFGCLVCCWMITGALAQDVNGVWRGELTQDPGGCYPKYFIEIQVQLKGNQIEGVTYDYYDTGKYVKLNFSGLLNRHTKKMVLTENKLLEFKIPSNCVPCAKTYDLTWSKKNNEEQLTGTWKGSQVGLLHDCPPGTIFLKKVTSSSFAQREQQPTIQKDPMPLSRKVELIQTIVVDTPNIKIELYDNGQVDGDTISVFLNDQLILHKKGLSEKPIVLEIPVEESKEYKMIMFAENLGTIPPNTALMVVTSGKKKYEIYLSSSEQKSSAVNFRYEK